MRIDPMALPTSFPDISRSVSPRTATLPETFVSSASNSQSSEVPQVGDKEVSVQWNEDKVMVMRFLDKRTGDLVEQVPSDEILKVVHNLEQLLRQQR